MSGETKHQESGWTVDTLKEHFDTLRKADQTALDKALESAKEAVLKAELASEKRFESVNEFRQTLSDQTNTFLPRPEYDANHKALEDKIDTKYSALDDKIRALTDRINTSDGQSKGSQLSKGNLYSAIGAVGAVLAIIVLLANNVF